MALCFFFLQKIQKMSELVTEEKNVETSSIAAGVQTISEHGEKKSENSYSSLFAYIVSLDLETTGLSVFKDRLIQLGAAVWLVHIENGTFEHVGDFEVNCRSIVRMHPKAIKITGITQEFVDQQSLSAKELLVEFGNFLDKMCKNDIPRVEMTYNGSRFDSPLMIYEAHRSKLGAENYFRSLKFTSSIDMLLVCRSVLDTTNLKHNATGLCSYKLGDIYQALLQKPLLNAHGGLADSRAVVDILKFAYIQFKNHVCAAVTGDYQKLSGVFNTMQLVRDSMEVFPKESSSGTNVFKGLAKRLNAQQDEKRVKIAKIEILENS